MPCQSKCFEAKSTHFHVAHLFKKVFKNLPEPICRRFAIALAHLSIPIAISSQERSDCGRLEQVINCWEVMLQRGHQRTELPRNACQTEIRTSLFRQEVCCRRNNLINLDLSALTLHRWPVER